MSFQFTPDQVSQLWQQFCEQLQLQLSPAIYNTWIVSSPISEIEILPSDVVRVTVSSPTAFHSSNLKKNLHTSIETTLKSLLQKDIEVIYRVGSVVPVQSKQLIQPAPTQPTAFQAQEQPSPFDTLEQNAAPAPQVFSPPQVHQPAITSWQQPFTPDPRSVSSPRVEDLFSQSNMQSAAEDRFKAVARGIGLRTDYTFDTFAVSTTNEMAHAAASAVSQRPGRAYNPLFLYGGVGVGKTHLMQAIGNNILHQFPQSTIIYCTGEEFTNEIVQAIRTKKASTFKERYRTADVLLIDDIQFIAGKNAVQEEFFHTFNALTKQQRQIVLTSDRPPHEMTLLEDRLRSRFEAGLMIDIQEPSFELRTAILLVKAHAAGISIPMELAKTIASRIDSARKLEGIVTTIRSEVELKKKSITPELIAALLDVEAPQSRKSITVSAGDIIKTVANHYKLKQSALKGTRRQKELVEARHVAMYLLKEELSLPLIEIGKWFSNRDHTTVIHATKKIEEQMSSDPHIQQDIAALRTTLAAVSK